MWRTNISTSTPCGGNKAAGANIRSKPLVGRHIVKYCIAILSTLLCSVTGTGVGADVFTMMGGAGVWLGHTTPIITCVKMSFYPNHVNLHHEVGGVLKHETVSGLGEGNVNTVSLYASIFDCHNGCVSTKSMDVGQ